MRLTRPFHFVRQFLRNPRATGALVPSGPALARAMAHSIDWERVERAVEVGPGSGAFTGELLERIENRDRLLLVEINPSFVEILKANYPGLEIAQESADNLEAILNARSIPCVDAIVSGLPWTIFKPDHQERLMASIRGALCSQGQFSTFTYLQGLNLPGGQRLVRLLETHFGSVRRSKVVWANVPPAVIFQCRC